MKVKCPHCCKIMTVDDSMIHGQVIEEDPHIQLELWHGQRRQIKELKERIEGLEGRIGRIENHEARIVELETLTGKLIKRLSDLEHRSWV